MDLMNNPDEEYENTISRKPKYLEKIWKTLLFLYACIVQAIAVSLTLLDTKTLLAQDIYMFCMYLFACCILVAVMSYLHINRRQTFEEATKEDSRSHKLAFSLCGEKVTYYLRFGVLLIGLFSLVYIVLSNAQIKTYKSECINTGLIISSSAQALFFVIQAIFILKYHSIIILRHTRLIQFGLFNIILVNIITWEISCLSKISYGGNIIVNDQNCTIKAISSLNLYFLPAMSEYSVIGMAIIYEIAKRIGKSSLIETGEEEEEEEKEYGSSGFIDKTKSAILGIVIAILIVLFCIGYTLFIILSDNIFHPSWVFYAHNGEECILYLLSIIILLSAYSKTRQLKFSFTFLQNNIDKNLLYVSSFLSIVFALMIAIYCFTFLVDNIRLVRSITALVEIVQICLQNVVIQDSFYRCSDLQEHRNHKPGQNLIVILIGLNFGIWILKSFQLKNGDIFFNKYQNVIQDNILYSFFLYVTLPLSILYRYHSSCCFAGAFSKIYQGEVERFEGMLRVEGFEKSDLLNAKIRIYQNQSSMSPQSLDVGLMQRSLTLPILSTLSTNSGNSADDKQSLAVRRQSIKNLEKAQLKILSSQMSHTMVLRKLFASKSNDRNSSSITIKDDNMLNCFNSLSSKRHSQIKRRESNPLDMSTSINQLYASIPNSPIQLDNHKTWLSKNILSRSAETLDTENSKGMEMSNL